MFSEPTVVRRWIRVCSLSAAVSAALILAATPVAGAPAEATVVPTLAAQGQETVDGVAQVSVSFDVAGETVRGVLYLPPGDAAHPGVLLNHDGEHGIDAALMRRARDLARLGYVVMTPAYRADAGSLGLARENGREVGDVLAGARALGRHPRVASEQIAILGTSHGAFVSMLAVAEEPKRFRCLAQASGAVDIPRVAGKVKLPVLLQHGWKDEVVEIGDAMYLSAEMRRGGNATAKLREYSLLGHNLWLAADATASTPDQVSQANWAWEDLTTFLDTYMQRGRPAVNGADGRQPAKAEMRGGSSGN